MTELFQIHYSPWSEKARWALSHRGVKYECIDYTPMLSEPRLRLKLGKLRGKVTVPVLFSEDGVLTDSFEIARWADSRGSGRSLFPDGAVDEIRAWNTKSEGLLAAGRANTTVRVGESTAAKRESVPGFIRALGPLATAMGSMGVSYLVDKYAIEGGDAERNRSEMRPVLDELRSALGDGAYLLGDFSYADVSMAVALQFVKPVRDDFVHLGTASRDCWTDSTLCEEYGDLIEWRDRTYDKHR